MHMFGGGIAAFDPLCVRAYKYFEVWTTNNVKKYIQYNVKYFHSRAILRTGIIDSLISRIKTT